MEEQAPLIQPAAVEMRVEGWIGGIRMQGWIDLIDVDGQIIDIKTAARRPSGVDVDHRFQIATYAQLAPGASGNRWGPSRDPQAIPLSAALDEGPALYAQPAIDVMLPTAAIGGSVRRSSVGRSLSRYGLRVHSEVTSLFLVGHLVLVDGFCRAEPTRFWNQRFSRPLYIEGRREFRIASN